MEFARAVALGLSDTPRWLPARFLYDARGSRLFEEITVQPEYYLTRTESSILARSAPVLAEETGPVTLIELGSGNSEKVSHVFSAYEAIAEPVRFRPVDVSETALRAAKQRIRREHPAVQVEAVVGTYEEAFPLFADHSPAMVMFLGSSIGNFAHAESYGFWNALADHFPAGDHFLLGVDLVKDPAILEAAYNDAAGVTAEFTKNVFERINRELDASIDLDAVEHVAQYDEEWQRVEIFARFHEAQEVRLGPLGRAITVEAGEQVLTEISRKFVLHNLEQFVRCFDFSVRRVFTDDREWFAVLLLRKLG